MIVDHFDDNIKLSYYHPALVSVAFAMSTESISCVFEDLFLLYRTIDYDPVERREVCMHPVYLFIYACTHICIRTHIRMHTDTHIHTHTYYFIVISFSLTVML